jgi:hypothetical protein
MEFLTFLLSLEPAVPELRLKLEHHAMISRRSDLSIPLAIHGSAVEKPNYKRRSIVNILRSAFSMCRLGLTKEELNRRFSKPHLPSFGFGSLIYTEAFFSQPCLLILICIDLHGSMVQSPPNHWMHSLGLQKTGENQSAYIRWAYRNFFTALKESNQCCDLQL